MKFSPKPLIAALLLAGSAAADEFEPLLMPSNGSDKIVLELADGRDSVRIDDTVSFCASVGEEGYLSLWNLGSSGAVQRIYPHTKQALDTSQPVAAGERVCVGESDRLRVLGPAGRESVVALWTKNRQDQLRAVQFASGRDFVKRGLVGGLKKIFKRRSSWATAAASFAVIPAADTPRAEPTPTVDDIARTHGPFQKVIIVAFGSNVGQLKMTNEDARLFADTLQASFNVPAERVRVYADATRADIEAGTNWARRLADEHSLVLWFFSGHGSRLIDDGNGDEDWDEAIVPYDLATAPDWRLETDKFIRDDELRTWIDRIPGTKLLAVDACFSGGLFKGGGLSGEATLLNARSKYFDASAAQDSTALLRAKGFAPAREDNDLLDGLAGQQPGRVVLLGAAQRHELASELPGRGGLFTVALYENLGQRPEASHWGELLEQLKHNVRRYTSGQQTPVVEDPEGILQQLRF